MATCHSNIKHFRPQLFNYWTQQVGKVFFFKNKHFQLFEKLLISWLIVRVSNIIVNTTCYVHFLVFFHYMPWCGKIFRWTLQPEMHAVYSHPALLYACSFETHKKVLTHCRTKIFQRIQIEFNCIILGAHCKFFLWKSSLCKLLCAANFALKKNDFFCYYCAMVVKRRRFSLNHENSTSRRKKKRCW